MRNLVFSSILLFFSVVVVGQQPCGQKLYERLSAISKMNQVSDKEFTESLGIVKELDSIHCNDYDAIINGQKYCINSLTFLFGVVCVKHNSTKAIIEYLKYMNLRSESAEEELAFSLERLFRKRPEDVLNYGGSLLDELAWGFVNNHYYGVIDPFENDPNKSFTRNNNPSKQVLTQKNYKEIFYEVNPTLKINYAKYQKQIDYLLNEIFEILKEANQ